MIHYHGTPISPLSELYKLEGRNFCVSFHRKDSIKHCLKIGQSLMLDNGAFSVWKKGVEVDWNKFYTWVEPLICPHIWAVIPDVIDGTEYQNDELIKQCPFKKDVAPVWHMHESFDRLFKLCENWDKVCIGSSGEYKTVGNEKWNKRMLEVFDLITDKDGRLPVWLHMLRGLKLCKSNFPFTSVDSTDIARNHHLPNKNALSMVENWDKENGVLRFDKGLSI